MVRFYFLAFCRVLQTSSHEFSTMLDTVELANTKKYETIRQCTDTIIVDTLSEDLLRLWIVDCLNLLFVHVPRLMNNSCSPKLSHQHTLAHSIFGGVHKSPKAKILYLLEGGEKKKRIRSTLCRKLGICRTIQSKNGAS